MEHPFVMILIFSMIGLVIIGALISIYIPLYEDYQSGCRHSQNGTILTHNSYSFAYNLAAEGSNEMAALGVSRYDGERTKLCAQYAQNSQKQQENAQNAINQQRQTYDSKSSDLALFQKCVNSSLFPNDTVFWNETGYHNPYLNQTVLNRLNCSIPNAYGSGGLGNGVFNCSGLPPCDMTCTGPDKVALVAATYDSGCTSEWMFHAGLFRFLFGLLVYVCINISRSLVMMAIIRLAWRSLTPKGFEFKATCNKQGEIDPEFSRKLSKAVDDAVKSYERGALVMLILAVLIHIPYIVLLNQFGNVEST